MRPTTLHVGTAWDATSPLASPSNNAAFVTAEEAVFDADAVSSPLMSPTSVQFDATDALFNSVDAGLSNSTAGFDSADSTQLSHALRA